MTVIRVTDHVPLTQMAYLLRLTGDQLAELTAVLDIPSIDGGRYYSVSAVEDWLRRWDGRRT